MTKENHNSRSIFHGFWALTNRDLKKWYKEPLLVFMSIIQPVLWMGLFGKAMNIGAIFTQNSINLSSLTLGIDPALLQDPKVITVLHALQNYISSPDFAKAIMLQTFGVSDYFSYIAVGMLSFVVVFTAMFSGMSIVWDRRLGFLNKALSTPVPRGTIIMSKVVNSVIRSLIQATIVIILALLFGMQLSPSFTVLNLLGAFAAMFLLCLGLSSLFLAIAIRSTKWETQMAVVNLLNLPLLFTSNALFPTAFMPDWLQTISKINPITYATDAARQLLIDKTVTLGGIGPGHLLFDFAFLGGFALIFASIGIILSVRYLSR
ncbi:MAG TPA: ABC transporter permease [Candidatus Krumholzibacteriaceae bacterium]|jgi:ABC-2 type transport system permease protein|nr:ABC transporter permease [Candidatus Krumholzibacteriaceae bacterium]